MGELKQEKEPRAGPFMVVPIVNTISHMTPKGN